MTFDANGNPIGMRDSLSGSSGAGFDIPVPGDNPLDVTLADFNGDDILDVATVSASHPSLAVFLGNGDGTLTLRSELFGVGRSIAAGDLNSDGNVDLVQAGAFSTVLSGRVWLGNGDGTFTPHAELSTGHFSERGVALGDVDGDGDLDIAVLSGSGQDAQPNAVAVFLNNGNGTFAAPNLVIARAQANLAWGDVDGDNDLDIFTTTRAFPFDDFVSVLLNDGHGTFSDPIESSLVEFPAGFSPALGDVNEDGRLDAVITTPRGVGVLLGQGNGAFVPGASFTISESAGPPRRGDVNGEDGNLDIAIAAHNPDRVLVFVGSGTGQFVEHAQFSGGPFPFGLALGDMNRDGDLDYVVTNLFESSVAVRLNDGFGSSSSSAPAQRTFEYDPVFNQPTHFNDELGRLTEYTLDPDTGNRLEVKRSVRRLDGDTDEIITQFTYTPQGLVDRTIDPLGRVTDNDYDNFGRTTETTYAEGTPDEATVNIRYDAAGNRTEQLDEHGRRTEFKYDVMNRVTFKRDPLGNETHYKYDAVGNIIQVEDARGNVTSNEYDALNRLVRTIEPDPDGPGQLQAPVTTQRYDPAGNLASITDPLGHETRHSYDARDRLVKTVDAEGGITRYEYDLAGNRSALIDSVGNRTEFLGRCACGRV